MPGKRGRGWKEGGGAFKSGERRPEPVCAHKEMEREGVSGDTVVTMPRGDAVVMCQKNEALL